MINKPTPFKGLNIRIPIMIPIKGRVFVFSGVYINAQGSENEGIKNAHEM